MNTPVTQSASFIVDPVRDGITNALWKTLRGTPTVNGNGQFDFNDAAGLVRADVKFGRFEFLVSFPALIGAKDLVLDGALSPGNFTVGETVTGGTSGATGVVLYESTDTDPELFVNTITGTFQAGEVITGGTSAATGTIKRVTFADPTLFGGGHNVSFGLSNASMAQLTVQQGNIGIVCLSDLGGILFQVVGRNGVGQIKTVPWQELFNSPDGVRFVIDWFDGKPMAKLSAMLPTGQYILDMIRQSRPFMTGETITGMQSGATATVVTDRGNGAVVIENLVGSFAGGFEEVDGSVSGAQGQGLFPEQAILEAQELARVDGLAVPTMPLNPVVSGQGAEITAAYIACDNVNQNSIMLI